MIYCSCGKEMKDSGFVQFRVKGQKRECYKAKLYICSNDYCANFIYIVETIDSPENCSEIYIDYNVQKVKVTEVFIDDRQGN